ncbi:MAG: EAL domain-containing protein [Rubrobacter sp.]|nr:EAL domain-containing protein [Rubrobacter sp.]
MYRAIQSLARHFEIEDDLDRTIEQNQIVLYYQLEIPDTHQPHGGRRGTGEVDASDARSHSSQGLHRRGGGDRLIFAIERWVLHETCRQMLSWQERYPTGMPLTTSVNLFSRHLIHPNLSGVIHHVLEETRLSPEHLVLEIKESILNEDAMSAAVTLPALKKLGI